MRGIGCSEHVGRYIRPSLGKGTCLKSKRSSENGKKSLFLDRHTDVMKMVSCSSRTGTQMSHSPDQNTNNIAHRTRENIPKICTEPEETWNSKSSLGQQEQGRRHHSPGLQVTLQSYSDQKTACY